MDILEQITTKGLTIAKANGLLDLAENYTIPHDEDKLKAFIKTQAYDLSKFSTLEHFFSQENLFIRAFVYTYGKGFEFTLAYMIGEPLERIAYNFDDCMTSNGLKGLPNEIRKIAESKIYIIREMFTEMFEMTRDKQSQLTEAGITFEDCIIKILNEAFFIGRRIAISIELDSKMTIQLEAETEDSKYDYDNYDNRYSL
ncbi:hypothetical protein [Flavobacterium undicola]|uniref:hypothetical protein n=1 Tax=Flavobacterium undicola TaxID=1932779 RepID=UPI001378C60D|nr:hypothetical protein [Flavobacterium undicola]MBA0882346.1 hypothetical protein [Flavobacterium undicola]